MIGRLLCLLALCMGALPLPTEDTKDPEILDVPLTPISTDTEEALKRLHDTLLPLHPKPRQRPTFTGEVEKTSVLYGDLFQTGDIYALVTLGDEKIGSGFAQWVEGHWEPRNLLKIAPVWRPQGWKTKEDEYFPVTPAERPFWVMDFNGKGALGVVIVGEVWKYWQQHELFWLDPKEHRLKWVESSMHNPHLNDGLLILPYDSGHRAIFGGERFMRWMGTKFEMQAKWHDESPYNNVAPHFVIGSRREKDGKVHRFTATDKNSDEVCYTLEKDGKPFGEVVFKQKGKQPNDFEEFVELLQAFLFEKFTGLPRRLFPSERKSKKKLEECAEVIVTGNDEAKKLLSPAKPHP